jgi:hypothetical protein
MVKLTYHIAKNGGHNKMDGIVSINTSTLSNPFCQKMMKVKDSVCSKCYTKRFDTSSNDSFYLHNMEELERADFVPFRINNSVVRFHSIGELTGEQMFKNMITLARFNPNSTFTLWTKRPEIVSNVLSVMRKPKNLILIYSSPVRNTAVSIDTIGKHFDKVFTVYELKYAKENGIELNCEKSCMQCMKCYTKNKIKYINEQAK